VLSAISVLLASCAGELSSGEDISLHLEVGKGCNPKRSITK